MPSNEFCPTCVCVCARARLVVLACTSLCARACVRACVHGSQKVKTTDHSGLAAAAGLSGAVMGTVQVGARSDALCHSLPLPPALALSLSCFLD